MSDQPAAAAAAKQAPAPPPPTYPVESKRRLSQSSLWRVQRKYFESQGAEAWKSGQVPFHITSNTFVAAAYARTLLGFLRDMTSPAAPLGRFDPAQPLYIVELAAGSGQFAFLFLKRLEPMLRALPAFRDLKLRYVMTDFTATNLDAWRKHEGFKPFLERGVLDFALFDIEADQELRLSSGEVLSAGSVQNPLCVIANYTFDTTTQDVFWVKNGALQEGLVSLLSTKEDEDLDDAAALPRLTTRYEQQPAAASYYGDEALDRILETYRSRLGDTSFLVPLGALRGIRSLQALAGGRTFLLTGDKGYLHEDEMVSRGEPQRALHGSFSMMVNYHALGLYFQQQGGLALRSSSRTGSLKFCVMVSGGPPDAFPETTLAFQESLDQFNPADYFHLTTTLRKAAPEAPLELMLPLLRLSEWDYQVVANSSASMARKAVEAPDALKRDLRRALERVSEMTYHMGRDVPFEVGRVYSGLSMPREALKCYEESLRVYGDHHATLFNIGLCYYRLHRPQEALEWMEKSLAKKPDFASAREWRNKIQAELGEPPA
jgi:tetratricopeptide (TPR) repeat protein